MKIVDKTTEDNPIITLEVGDIVKWNYAENYYIIVQKNSDKTFTFAGFDGFVYDECDSYKTLEELKKYLTESNSGVIIYHKKDFELQITKTA